MAGMGFLGAIGGAGQGTAQVGDTLLRDSLARDRQAEQDDRAARILEYKVGAERQLADEKYRRERKDALADADRDRQNELADAEQKRKDAEAADARKHKDRLAEIVAEADAKNKGDANKKDKEMFGKVELKNGQVVSESDLRGEYQTRYGKFDPMGNLISMDPAAPTFDKYRNDLVKPDYQRSYSGGPFVATKDARKQAEAEAEAKDPTGPDFLRPGATKEAFGEGGRDEWIKNRAKQIEQGNGGFINTPTAFTANTTGSKVAPSVPTGDNTRSAVANTAPPAAIEYLRKNPQLKDAFKAKYGYLPEGI